jgi:AcrR family transcriptional regulator
MTYVMTTTSVRQRMVQSTALLIRERGVAGTGMRDIADHARAPRGSLQHYFPAGKQQVVTEALEWAGDQVSAGLAKLAAAEEPVAASVVVAKVFARWHRVLIETDYLAGCPMVATITDAAGDDALRSAAARAFARWQEALVSALRRGGLGKKRAERVALLTISALEGAIVLARAQRDVAPLDAVAREMEALVRTLSKS